MMPIVSFTVKIGQIHERIKAGESLSQSDKESLLGHDYQIGHARLMNLKYATSLTANCILTQASTGMEPR